MKRVVVVVLVLASCGEPGREELTVVVEADRARAAADQARLAEMQASLAGAKQDLEVARADLTALSAKLQKAGLMTAEEARKLDERARAIEAREAKLPSASASANLTREELDALLRAHEERMRAIVEQRPAIAAIEPSAEQPTKAEVEALLQEAARQREARGLHLSDVPDGAKLETLALSQLRANKTSEAAAKVRALVAAADGVTVDMAFVQRKFARCNARVASMKGDAAKRAKALLAEATERVAAGDLVGASARLSAVLALAEE